MQCTAIVAGMSTDMGRYPDLCNFLASYLGQDLYLEYPDADAAIDDAIKCQPVEERRRAQAQLDDLLSQLHDEDAASKAVRRLYISYYPPGDGRIYLAWLRHVQERLRTAERSQ